MKPVSHARKVSIESNFDEKIISEREKAIEEMAGKLFRIGFSEMEVYRQLGFSTREDWEWLREIKDK